MNDDLKAKGNTAFTKGNYLEAISHFTEAINLDPTNYVLYSNRSAAYAALKKFDLALTDAEETIKHHPSWSKGYSRKGSALYGLKRYEEAKEAYRKGLELEPNSASLQKGLDEATIAAENKDVPSLNPFASEEAMGRLFTDPTTRQFIGQPDFIQKINEIRQNPSSLSKHMQDQRIMQAMFVAMGLSASFGSPPPAKDEASTSTVKPQQQPTTFEPPRSCGSSKIRSYEKPSDVPPPTNPVDELKEKGNAEFKKKNFEAALSFYDQALAQSPDSINILLNKSAVYFEQERFDECIETCLECVERGRTLRVEFKLIARAYGRVGSAYARKNMLDEAITYYNKSLAEHRTADILEKLRQVEAQVAAAKKAAYFSPEIANKERELGNELFKKGEFAQALQHYSESIARDETDPRGYSNRAACYTKLAAFPEAIKDCDRCIELDPSFIKAYLRKASIFFGLKEYQKCLDVCFSAKAQDKESRHIAEIESYIAKCHYESQKSTINESAEQTLQRAMADPEIRALMTDPVMQSILQQMQNDPRAIQDHMKNPVVANNIRKLMAAGIIRTS